MTTRDRARIQHRRRHHGRPGYDDTLSVMIGRTRELGLALMLLPTTGCIAAAATALFSEDDAGACPKGHVWVRPGEPTTHQSKADCEEGLEVDTEVECTCAVTP